MNAAEAINAAGGEIVKSDGKTPDVDTPAAAKGLDFLVNGFKQGYIPKQAIGFQETQSLNAFEAGQLVYMRNWPYADAILSRARIRRSYRQVRHRPAPRTHRVVKPGASSLGGHSVGISRTYSKHPATDFDFLKFAESDVIQNVQPSAKGTQRAGASSALYTRTPTPGHEVPAYLPVLLQSISAAVPRPITPFYPAVTKADSDQRSTRRPPGQTVDCAKRSDQPAGRHPVGNCRRLSQRVV